MNEIQWIILPNLQRFIIDGFIFVMFKMNNFTFNTRNHDERFYLHQAGDLIKFVFIDFA